MAFKGPAAKSSSGASMSKYDVEVEGRLSALETAVAALQADSHPARSCTTAAPAGVSARLLALSVEVKKHEGDRISLAFNSFFKGTIGCEPSLSELTI